MATNVFLEANEVGNVEEPSLDAKFFYEKCDVVNRSIYVGCREILSRFSLATRMMNIRIDHNLPKICMDARIELFKEYLKQSNLCDVFTIRFNSWFILSGYFWK